MKALIRIQFVFLMILCFGSCKPPKEDRVQSFVSALNNLELLKAQNMMSDRFIYTDSNGKKFSKTEYLELIDSLMSLNTSYNINSIHYEDSVVKTKEKVTNLLDSILEVNPKIIQCVTYTLDEDRISKITMDSLINKNEYEESLNSNYIPFEFWVDDNYNVSGSSEIFKSLKKYLAEYSSMPPVERKNYRSYAYLQGTYISNDNRFYKKLEFKGRTTVVVIDAIFGLKYPTSYVLDNDFIRIQTDKSDLLLEIKDSNTLLGEGYAKGTYHRD
ncbi:hypothetical protein [Fulvivirga sediminis]|uniref:Uncharacterized protein n=1 Tax=Fulvivirga sediminis TaxID=2803949 RepID=A0A937K0T3_9BACT|nr:hypothetical protein [Fulvivirga sediminis]MBL3656696.1 hypothetical protein [Fulvivirga sediminis]